MYVNIYLFDDFESLDIFGPIEVLGRISEYKLEYYSEFGRIIKSAQGAEIITKPISNAKENEVFVIPGGKGTRTLTQNVKSIDVVRKQALASKFCLSICTGSAVLAKGGVLDGKSATSNKRALEWVKSNSDKVLWVDRARWCVDGKFYTASGVSAGIDMTLGFISAQFGESRANEIADSIEYVWNREASNDLFA